MGELLDFIPDGLLNLKLKNKKSYGKIISMQKAFCNTKVERNNRKINNHDFRIVELQFCFP